MVGNYIGFCRLFLQRLQVAQGASAQTIRAYEQDLRQFFLYLEKRGLSLEQLTHVQIRAFLSHLHQSGYARSSIARKLSCLRGFLGFLKEEGQVGENPMELISSSKRGQRVPQFLYSREMEALLQAPDLAHPLGIRDRAIMETLYASGMRVSELVGLRLPDLDFSLGVALVFGKGSKERYVMLGRPCQEAIRHYLNSSRPFLLTKRSDAGLEDYLFLNRMGTPLTDRSVRRLIEKYVQQVSLTLKVTPHTFRHTFATHLLNGGADMRVVQELLGHVHLSTTQVYTHTTKEHLRGVYLRTHPRAADEEVSNVPRNDHFRRSAQRSVGDGR